MPTRTAIFGLDAIQRDWLCAIDTLAGTGAVTPVAAGHQSVAQARDASDLLRVPAFDDFRIMLRRTTPQLIVLDRPENVTAEMLAVCLDAGAAIISLGPPVHTLAEARALAGLLEPRTAQLLIASQFIHTPGYVHGTHPDVLARPVRFVSGEFHALNHALARGVGKDASQMAIVRSLSVLMWDALASVIDFLGLPESVYASIRGTTASGDVFTDISGGGALVLRLTDESAGSIVVSITLSDQAPAQRALLVLTANGVARVADLACSAHDTSGRVLDETQYPPVAPTDRALATLKVFLEQFLAPPSPHRGWPHRLVETAACMEAAVVSHRTGQPESPEKFLSLRR